MYSNFTKIFLTLFLIFISYLSESQTDLTATGYDSHVELNWTPVDNPNVTGYQIWSSTDGVLFTLRKLTSTTRFILDFVQDLGTNVKLKYKVKPILAGGIDASFSNEASATIRPMSDDELMTMVQKYTFRYFNEYAHPASGMALDRNSSGDVVTTGGTGFGIMAWVVAAERGFVTRNAAVQQLFKITNFLAIADRFHGAFPHFINGTNGHVVPFSQYDNGGDLVETAFLMQGLLTARQYFTGTSDDETYLRAAITQLWEQVDWSWYRKDGGNVLYWHWSPNYAWKVNFPIRGYNEALIVYLLAIASPTHPVPASLYQSGWAGNSNYVNGQTYYGEKLQVGAAAGGPLFFAHYSFLGFDPRNKRDAYANYFTHNVAQSKINWAYCASNPLNFKGYSADCWGLTASDDPNGYSAHAPLENTDNGTITPSAALSSMPYTPVQSIAALKNFYRVRGAKLFGAQGFYDAFNPQRDWIASSYLAIDQGPIVGMIENYRTGLLWKYFMQNKEIKPALDAIGFKADVTPTKNINDLDNSNIKIYPNPSFSNQCVLSFNLNKEEKISARIVNIFGQTVREICSDKNLQVGENNMPINIANLLNGTYYIIGKRKIEDRQFSIFNFQFSIFN